MMPVLRSGLRAVVLAMSRCLATTAVMAKGRPIESAQVEYRKLFAEGRYVQAIASAERALAWLRAQYGATSNELPVGLNDLATILNSAGRARVALAPVREAITIWEARGDTVRAATGLGIWLSWFKGAG